MSKSTSVNPGDHFEQFVGAHIASGHFGSASEVIRAGLRLLEERDIEQKALRHHVDESGVAIHGYDPVACFTEEKPVKGKRYGALRSKLSTPYGCVAPGHIFPMSPCSHQP